MGVWAWVPAATLGPGPALLSDPGQGPDISAGSFLTSALRAGPPTPASPREAFQRRAREVVVRLGFPREMWGWGGVLPTG